MDPVEFLGITFRNDDHMGWFIITMTILISTFIIGAVSIMWAKNYEAPRMMWLAFGWFSALTSLDAVFETRFGTVNGYVYSVDCIWYNALLAGIYFSTAALCTSLDRRRRRRHRQLA